MSGQDASQYDDDSRLVEVIAVDLLKEGGTCRIESLIPLNPLIRRLLGDRKLLGFLMDFPESFSLQWDGNDCGATKVSLASNWTIKFPASVSHTTINKYICNYCSDSFCSRNKLFSHIRMHENENNRSTDDKLSSQWSCKLACDVISSIVWELNNLRKKVCNYSVDAIPLSRITSRKRVAKALRCYLREMPTLYLPYKQRYEYGTPQWWASASRELLVLLHHRPSTISLVHPAPAKGVYTAHSLRDVKVVVPIVPSPISNTPTSSFAPPDELLDCLKLRIPFLCRRGRVSLSRIRNDVSIRSCAARHGYCIGVSDVLRAYPTYSRHLDDCQCGSEDVVFIDKRKYDIHPIDCEVAVGNPNGHVLCDTTELEFLTVEPGSYAVVNKPSGLRMENLVSFAQRNLQLFPEVSLSEQYLIRSVSRLDQPTSGAVVLPLSPSYETYLTSLFKNRGATKYYLCVVHGHVERCSIRTVDVKLKHVGGDTLKSFPHHAGKPSVTKYFCIDSFRVDEKLQADSRSNYSLVLCKPLTGRTHQIRAHMAHAGFPLVGDVKYGRNGKLRCNDSAIMHRLMLHSYRLEFVDVNGCTVRSCAPIPTDMFELISRLRSECKCQIDSTSSLEEVVNDSIDRIRNDALWL